MTKQVQLRRGTTAEHAIFTGAEGELTIDTTLDIAIVHDGSTVGGRPLVGAAATQVVTNKTGVGIGTSAIQAQNELRVIGDVRVKGDIDARSITVRYEDPIQRSGIISATSSNKITGIATNNIRVGYGVTGTNIGIGVSVVSLGIGTVFLAIGTNTTNVTQDFSGVSTGNFLTNNGTTIIGVNTSSISVGYGVSGTGVLSNTTVTGISSLNSGTITISQVSTGTLGITTRTGTVGSSGTTDITGVTTTSLAIGDYIDYNGSLGVSTISSIGVNQVVSSVGLGTSGSVSFTFSRVVSLVFVNLGFTTDFAFVDPYMGQANIDVLNVNNATIQRLNLTELNGGDLNLTATNTNVAKINSGLITNAYISSGNINVGIATTMIVNNNYMNVGIATTMVVTAANLDLAYINVGIGTTVGIQSARLDNAYISVGIGTTVGIQSARLDNAYVSSGVATYLNVTGFTTIANYVNGVPDPNSNVTIGVGKPYNLFVLTGTLGTSYSGVGTNFIAGIGTNTISGIGTNRVLRTISATGVATEYSTGTYVSVASTTSGSGTGARFNLTVGNGDIITITVERGGSGYLIGDLIYLNAAATGIGLTPPTLGLSTTKVFTVTGVSTAAAGQSIQGSYINAGTTIDSVGVGTIFLSQYSTNTGVQTGVNFEVAPRSSINLDVTGNARVTGILTVGASSITLDGGTSNITGVDHLRSREFSASQRVVVDYPTVITYQGTLAYASTTRITGIATANIGVGYAITDVGGYLLPGASVASIGNSSITLTGFAQNVAPTQTTPGYIESVNGNKIAGINTNNIFVGSAATGTYIAVGSTVISIGIGSVILSQNTTSPVGEVIRQGTVVDTGISTITGIGTTGIIVGEAVFAASFILPGTTVASIGNSSITLSQPTSQVGVITQTFAFRRLDSYQFVYPQGAVVTEDFYFEDAFSGISTIPNLRGRNLFFSGIGSFDTVIADTTIITSGLIVENIAVPGIGTIGQLKAGTGIVTTLTGTDISYTGLGSFGNVKIGYGDTDFIVHGDARITGVLTVGQGSVTISGNNNEIVGANNLNSQSGIVTFLQGSNLNYTGVSTLNKVGLSTLTFVGVNTQTTLSKDVTLKLSNAGVATNYTLTLPPDRGRDGMVLTVDTFGNLGFATAGLYENRIYVSNANGNDLNDGKTRPVKTIKKASQLASFESFVLPPGRYLDAANLLQLNKSFIQDEVIGFTTATYPGITTSAGYATSTCRRDVGYIVDALVYDLTYGGNSKSVGAGVSYWLGVGGTSYVEGERIETVDSFAHIVDISKYIINNVAIADPGNRFDDASRLLTLNKEYIKNEVVGYVTAIYPGLLTNPTYNRTKCLRDVGYIVDALAYDVKYGGNYKSVGAGVSYWSGIGTFDVFQVRAGSNGTTIIIDAGISSIPHTYVSGGTVSFASTVGVITSNVSNLVYTPSTGITTITVSSSIAGIRTGDYVKLAGIALSCSSWTGITTYNVNALSYDNTTGICTVTLSGNHGLVAGEFVQLGDIILSCGSTTVGYSTTKFPYPAGIGTLGNSYPKSSQKTLGGTFNVFRTISGTNGSTVVIDVGISTYAHTYVSGGTATIGITSTIFPYPGSSPKPVGGISSVGGEQTETVAAFRYIAGISSYIINNITVPQSYQVGVGSTAQVKNLTISYDATCGAGTSYGFLCCANVRSNINNLVGIITSIVGGGISFAPAISRPIGLYQTASFQSYDFSIAYDDTASPGIYTSTACANVQSTIANLVGIITSIIGIGTTATPTVTTPSVKSQPVAIIVEAGEYEEDNPIILYEDVAVIGDNLRNTIIRPLNAGKDLLRVRNGCYLIGFAMKDYVDAAGVPQYTFDNAVAFDDPSDPLVSRLGYAVKTGKSVITRSPYIQNCSILSFLGANGMLVDGSKVLSPNIPIIPEEAELSPDLIQPEQGKSMVAAAFTMVSFGGIGWRVINDGYSQVVSCFQIFCRYGSLAQSGGYLSITNSATNFGFYALRSTGFSANSFAFDRGRIAATGTSGGYQTLTAIGVGRSDQDLYVTRFFNNNNIDQTSNFKPLVTTKEFNAATEVDINLDTFNIVAHGFNQGDSVVYFGDEGVIPPRIIGGLVNQNQYYVQVIDANSFKVYEDNSFTKLVNLTETTTGINTFTKNNQEFFVKEIIPSGTHNSYQAVGLASTSSTIRFVSGRQVTQAVTGGNAVGFALTYNSSTRVAIFSVEAVSGVRRNFGVTGGANGLITDHSPVPVSIAATSVSGITTYWTINFKIESTTAGTQVIGISSLPEVYKLHFHRPSIINSSSHTWEYSGSGIDYNALPQNGGKTVTKTQQVSELGGRTYTSGTNELGDFLIGDFITAYNRTGNIIFNNTVTIGTLDSIRLSLSGGVQIEEFSVDVGLGDNEIGGPANKRVSTQLAVRTFLNNRLGSFIDKTVSTNAVPSAVVQLNSIGQINADLIPPKVVNYFRTIYAGGRTSLANRIPAADINSGDTVVEPINAYVLVSDVLSQYIILSDSGSYNFQNGDLVRGTVSQGGAIGLVTAPPYTTGGAIGYGTTGLVKGVSLTLNTLAGGSGYSSAGIYSGVQALRTTGIGTGMSLNVTVSAGGTISAVAIETGGKGYAVGDYVTVAPANVGGRVGGADFTVRVGSVETRLYLTLTNNQKFLGSLSLPDYISDRNATAISTNVGLASTASFTGTGVDVGGNVDFTNDRIVVGASNTIFTDGDPIRYYSTGNVVEPLVLLDTYYVKRVGLTSVELYDSYALSSKVNLTDSGTGTHTLTRLGINTTTNQIVFVNHGLTQGDPVRITVPNGNVTPAGITTDAFYFIGSRTTNSFTLHLTRSDALLSANGLLYNTVDIIGVGTAGIVSFTKQNITYTDTVNTSSTDSTNWALLATSTVDAANIVSGTVSPSRLGSGSANSQTFLRGDSSYQKVVMSVGIGTTQPLGVTASSADFAPGGIGINTYYGNVNITLNRVYPSLDTYGTLGIARFKNSTFGITTDGSGSVFVKTTSQGGDIDAATFNGNAASYYLDINNIIGNIPITRGGTGLQALPASGAILIGNGSSYNLTATPTFTGSITFAGISAALNIQAGGDITGAYGTWTGDKAGKIQFHSNNLYLQYTGAGIWRNSSGTNTFTIDASGNTTFIAPVTATRFISNIATGTAPLTVTSTTRVDNLNAQYLSGLPLNTDGRADNANEIVRTDSNGYIQAGWINTTSGDLGVGNRLDRVYTSNDGYIRYLGLTDFKNQMGLSSKNNYSRRIDYTTDSNYWVGSMGHSGYGANETFHGGSGFFDIWSGTNYPSGFSHIHGINMLHYTTNSLGSTGGNAYGWQLCTQYDSDAGPYWRRVNGGSFTGWRKIWHDSNDGSGSGLDADLLDGYNASTGRSGSTVAVRDSSAGLIATYFTPGIDGGNSGNTRSSYPYSFGFQETGGWSYPYPDLVLQYHTGVTLAANNGYEGIRFKRDYSDDTVVFQVNGASNYIFKYNWMYTNTTGFYSDTNGWHIHPNDLSSYGGTALRGSRNGWRGIHFYDGGNTPHVMFDGSANGGFYYESTGRWSLYYSHSNASWGVNTSSTSSSYAIYTSGNIYATGVITAASDERKKKEIETVTNALEKVNQLRGVTYKRIDYSEGDSRYDKVEIGVIAQEVEPILPEVVTYAPDVDEYAVSYGNFAGLFIEAIKEQTEIINSLKKEIEELKSKLGEQ